MPIFYSSGTAFWDSVQESCMRDFVRYEKKKGRTTHVIQGWRRPGPGRLEHYCPRLK